MQEEFDALWGSPFAVPLADAVIQDVQRLASRRVLWSVPDWAGEIDGDGIPDPASAVIEAPVYRREVGLWAHQKAFVKLAFDAHGGPARKARLVLADQVGPVSYTHLDVYKRQIYACPVYQSWPMNWATS